jgi:hypothetical protein
MNTKTFLTGAALLIGLLPVSQAHAANIFLCNGNPVVWEHSFVMVRNKPSIPAGTPPQDAFINAVDRWNGVRGMADMVSISPFVTLGLEVDLDDDQNDAVTTGRAALGGFDGLTFLDHSLCVLSSSWSSADVAVANDLPLFGHVDETSLASSGRVAFLRQVGMAHGLTFRQGFDGMRVFQPIPLVGGPGETVDVLPDDANGGRFLYPTGNSEVNLFASAHRRTANDQIVLNNSGTLTVCSKGGTNVTLTSTVGNNGTVDIQQTERWWISTSSTAHNGGTLIGQWNGSTFLAGTVNTRQVTFKMPALAPGTYFLFHGVDALHEVTESREGDNAVREGMKIKVVNC